MPGAQHRKGGPRSFRRRTMPPPGHIPETVAPGWALTITSADFGGLGAVTETPPAGFGCASSDLDDGEVQATGQQVRFTLQGDSPSPYIVNTPSQEGVYPFSGMLRDSDRKDTPAGGASGGRATVQQPSNPGPLCAQRTTRPPFLSRRRPFSLGPAAGPPLSLTTTVLPEHLVRSTNGGYGTGQKDCHFRVEGGVALT